ncbi:uncharacterized protein PG986_010126 [Apiospora aurea]|uniref:Ankyrin n=1 Tax=Apiospora aurea TaxID=335848 RepID=A0ABR1Q9Y0_9PEZI
MTQLISSSPLKRPSRSTWKFKSRPAKTPGGKTELHWAVINDLEPSSQPTTNPSTPLSRTNAILDVNAQDQLGRSALHWAAVLKNTKWAQHLMGDMGADVLLQDIDGKTPLHEAATNGSEGIVKLLLGNQKVLDNIDAQDNLHRTALHWAADHGNERVVLLLTSSDANVLATDISSNTALHRAVRSRHEDIVTHLICRLTDGEERKALLSAIEDDHLDVAKELCRQHAGNEVIFAMKKGSWEPLLWHAAETGDVSMVELLLTKKVGVRGWGPHAQRPLELAAMNGHDGVVQRLLRVEHIDVNATASKWTALILAARDGHDPVVQKLLLVDHVDPNAACLDLPFWTPLQYAAMGGHASSVELLLGHEKLEVDAADSFGQTALSFAAEKGHTAVLEVLIEKGASVTLPDNRGRSPASFAAEKGKMDAVRLLIEKGARMGSEGKNAILTGSGEFFRLEDADAKTPLQYARGHEDVFKLMLSECNSLQRMELGASK